MRTDTLPRYLNSSPLLLTRKVWQGRVGTTLRFGRAGTTWRYSVDDGPATTAAEIGLAELERLGYIHRPAVVAPGDDWVSVRITPNGEETLRTMGADQQHFHEMSAANARHLCQLAGLAEA